MGEVKILAFLNRAKTTLDAISSFTICAEKFTQFTACITNHSRIFHR